MATVSVAEDGEMQQQNVPYLLSIVHVTCFGTCNGGDDARRENKIDSRRMACPKLGLANASNESAMNATQPKFKHPAPFNIRWAHTQLLHTTMVR